MKTPWYEQAWGKVLGGIDFVIDDWVADWSGSNNQPLLGMGGNPYAETTAPLNPAPTEAGFTIGNNAATYAGGFGLLLLALIAYKAIK